MKKITLFAATVALMMSACTKEDQPIKVGEAYLQIAQVSASEMETRADKAYGGNITINVSGVENYGAVNGVVLSSNNNWAIATPIELGTDERTLTAWAPTELTETTVGNNTFDLTSADAATAKDLIFANAKVSAANPSASLTLTHAYSKITLKFVKNNIPEGVTPVLTGLKLNVPSTSTINIATGAYGTPGANADIAFADAIFTSVPAALVVPATTPTVKVKCTIDGIACEVDLSAKVALAAGTNYVVTMTFEGKILKVSSVNETEWVNEDVDGGTLNPVI